MTGLLDRIKSAKLSPRNDMIKGILAYRIWLTLAWHETKLKYRRSVIGPFWITLTTVIMVGFLGVLYGILLNQPLNEYLPYLAAGLVIWQFIAAALNESCDSLINSAISIRQFNQPITIYCARSVVRNYIVLIHNIPVAIVCLIIFKGFSFSQLLLAAFGFILLFLEMIWINIVISILCLRFRDIKQIINNIVQVGLFVTPIIWQNQHLGHHQWVGQINPFFNLIEIVRAPMLGQAYPWVSLYILLAGLVFGYILAELLMIRARNRISYWL